MLHIAPLLFVPLGPLALVVDDWHLSSLAYVETDMEATPYHVDNNGYSSVFIASQSGSVTMRREILGAGTSNPPAWDSRFSPLTTSSVVQSLDRASTRAVGGLAQLSRAPMAALAGMAGI